MMKCFQDDVVVMLATIHHFWHNEKKRFHLKFFNPLKTIRSLKDILSIFFCDSKHLCTKNESCIFRFLKYLLYFLESSGTLVSLWSLMVINYP